jgi:hypothetical protein
MTSTQKKMLRYVTIRVRLKWKTGNIRKGDYIRIGPSVSEYGGLIFHITRSPFFFRENIFNIPCELSV